MNQTKAGAPAPVRAKLAEQANTQPTLKKAGLRVVQTSDRPGKRNFRKLSSASSHDDTLKGRLSAKDLMDPI